MPRGKRPSCKRRRAASGATWRSCVPERQRARGGVRWHRAAAAGRGCWWLPTIGSRRGKYLIVTLAARHAILTVYDTRDVVAAGGLMSYGASLTDALSAGWRLHRENAQGRQTRRPSGGAVDQIRADRSTCRPPKPSASLFRRRFWPSLTRSSNKNVCCAAYVALWQIVLQKSENAG